MLSLVIKLSICVVQVSLLSIVTPKNLVLFTDGRGSSDSEYFDQVVHLLQAKKLIVTVFVRFNVSLFALNHCCKLLKSCWRM